MHSGFLLQPLFFGRCRILRSSPATCFRYLSWKERIQFGGRPIASHQLVQEKLVWMVTEITKGQFLALQVARLKDTGKLKHYHVSMAKRNNVWVARESARLAREILGANGIVDDYPVIRHMLNIESVYTYEGTHDIHALIMGEAITGIAAFNPPLPPQPQAVTSGTE